MIGRQQARENLHRRESVLVLALDRQRVEADDQDVVDRIPGDT